MTNKITAAKTPWFITVLAVLLGLSAAGLLILLTGPYVVDLYTAMWTSAVDAASWVADHTLVPVWDMASGLFG